MALGTIAIQDKSLTGVAEKVLHGERLTLEDGVALFHSNDLLTIGQLANFVNQKKNGDNVYFLQNLYINPTNVCEAHCKFCGFRRDQGEDGAYTMNMEELLHYVETRFHPGIREFHIVGGHNQHMPFDYYLDTLRTLKKAYPDVTIKSYTGAEIEFFSRIAGLSIREVLQELMKAGLQSLTGGGAEILTERYRMKMSPEKASTDMYLQVHRTAHELGLKTHTTMLYGSIETLEERVIHMLRLRELQDDTNGFMVFIPLAVQPIKATAGIKRRNSAIDDLKTMAISRLMLDNFQHIKAYFINIGTQLTQLSLTMGISDAHGTLIEERISHAAGALTQQALTVDELVWLIKGAGKRALERDTFYNVIKEH
ncbi:MULTISPECIES: aminofutalosine synthase MqnE [Brevibacillus]|uniref:aminofutalosine synthase MqnE n=1 Tax=Brevibacillus TaxID=55080 RepID=UPI0020415AB8|nr:MULTISPECIES: aminofutalosine synthase MqnE [Brevibacillus]MCM3080812.1 aminofutalosine synthase MqnE [Brevibacillus invocatus]MCM3430999.1 aminofutalosine synthase MqnE [Brevibacillus invocatus]MDH4618521.1 aminofutalosine synthase MqnE [Brevibacillus sp. AY1]